MPQPKDVTMPKTFVNLDALIRRDHFETLGSDAFNASAFAGQPSVNAKELESGSVYRNLLRKPEFQRETASWDPEKVVGFIKSFVDGHLIPSVILWASPGNNIFVIDGAHRLSAIIAWISNDYGDGIYSRDYFGQYEARAQRRVAAETAELVRQEVGTYADLTNPLSLQNDDPAIARRAAAVALVRMYTLWVPGTDVRTAEQSFFMINQQATPIDPTELSMIKARRMANAVVARALIRSGSGHKYWSRFETSIQEQIEAGAKRIHELLFLPPSDYPIVRSLDQPVAGPGYSSESAKMVFELVNYLNGVSDPEGLQDDNDGAESVKFLDVIEDAATLIAGRDPGSLGLHPFVYFYSASGRFQPTAFLATIRFMLDLRSRGKLSGFTANRSQFEDFIFKYRHFNNLISKRFGSLQRGVGPTLGMYEIVLSGIEQGQSEEQIVAALKQDKRLSMLAVPEDEDSGGTSFGRGTKNAVVIQARMEGEPRCGFCMARLYFNANTHDHIVPVSRGGTGSQSNSQLVHPYCGSLKGNA